MSSVWSSGDMKPCRSGLSTNHSAGRSVRKVPFMKTKALLSFAVLSFVVGLAIGGNALYKKVRKQLPYYPQLVRDHARTAVSLQPESQRGADYVGSAKCGECHEGAYRGWSGSNHSKMIQDVAAHPDAIVGDFVSLPEEADFALEEVVYTIGGKFKQRYMLQAPEATTEDYVIGNHQWNTELDRWQPYRPYNDWYTDAFPHDNKQVNTSKTCDGCHFVGFMSREERVEPGISCESCHGPGSAHSEDPVENRIYVANTVDPRRGTEVCLQCHMRNRDIRLETASVEELFGDVRDYPMGFEPGMPLMTYKAQAPYTLGEESSEFYANGIGRKNRMQGNEYIHSAKYQHGITCVNCHSPHRLNTRPSGDGVCMKCHDYGSPIGPHQQDLSAHTRHEVDSEGSSCIECHMPKTGRHLRSSPLTVRTHIFGFITPDDTRRYGVPNSCTSCHDDKDLDWAEASLREWGMNQWR